jgi:hypothetical protein
VLLAHYLTLLHEAQCRLAGAFDAVAAGHPDETELVLTGRKLAVQCRDHASRLAPVAQRYGRASGDVPDDLHSDLFHGPRPDAFGVLRDLHDLYLMTAEVDVVWTLVGQAAQGARDEELHAIVTECEGETAIQMKWCETQLRQRAPQVLVVAREPR